MLLVKNLRMVRNSNKAIDDETIKAIICPHAGYMYCGGTAAYSYHHVDTNKINRVFILGPDHCGATHSGKIVQCYPMQLIGKHLLGQLKLIKI